MSYLIDLNVLFVYSMPNILVICLSIYQVNMNCNLFECTNIYEKNTFECILSFCLRVKCFNFEK